MQITCLNFINNLKISIDKANYHLIDNMTDLNMKYEWVCIKPNLTYDYFFEYLKKILCINCSF